MINLVIIGVMFCFHAYATDTIFNTPPYNISDTSFQEQAGSVITLKKSLAQRNQGSAGHCFAFSTASAIDYFLCSDKIKHFEYTNLCDNNQSIVSTLHLTSLSTGSKNKKIVERGVPSGILLTIREDDPNIILETCAPYEKYLEYLAQYNGKKVGYETLFQAAKREYNEQLSLNYNCGEEFAKILSGYSNYKEISQILALSKGEDYAFEQLMYETMIPRTCIGKGQTVDVYKELDYDSRQGIQFLKRSADKTETDYDYFITTVTEQISQDTPVIINFFTGASDSGADKERVHSALITGIKKVCNPSNECKTLFKIHNSYGSIWQAQNNDGWVEANPLIERSILTTPALVWPKKK